MTPSLENASGKVCTKVTGFTIRQLLSCARILTISPIFLCCAQSLEFCFLHLCVERPIATKYLQVACDV